MSDQTRVLVTGAGGFIGHHLVKYLTSHAYWVRGVDIKQPEYEATSAQEFTLARWSAARSGFIANCLQKKNFGSTEYFCFPFSSLLNGQVFP